MLFFVKKGMSEHHQILLEDGTYSLQMHCLDERNPNEPKRMLFEVPENVLEAVLKGGPDALTITGENKDSPAMMRVNGITDTEYILKACETSNTVLVGPRPTGANQPIRARAFGEVVECVATKPTTSSKA